MKTAQDMVQQFHEVFKLPILDRPRFAPKERMQMRLDLIEEEVSELELAVAEGDLVETADALADLVYVTYGMALELGIDLDAVVAEVHRSNMTKLWRDEDILEDDRVAYGTGTSDRMVAYREDGKVLKPPTWQPPQIKEVLGL